MADTTDLGSLKARLVEVEPGLFKAEYVERDREDGDTDAVSIPDSHIGTNREGVRMWVEQMAANMGYRKVIWQ